MQQVGYRLRLPPPLLLLFSRNLAPPCHTPPLPSTLPPFPIGAPDPELAHLDHPGHVQRRGRVGVAAVRGPRGAVLARGHVVRGLSTAGCCLLDSACLATTTIELDPSYTRLGADFRCLAWPPCWASTGGCSTAETDVAARALLASAHALGLVRVACRTRSLTTSHAHCPTHRLFASESGCPNKPCCPAVAGDPRGLRAPGGGGGAFGCSKFVREPSCGCHAAWCAPGQISPCCCCGTALRPAPQAAAPYHSKCSAPLCLRALARY